jgi:pimeloyl-ACP methyl ester carboxylesterase
MDSNGGTQKASTTDSPGTQPEIHFCTASDGVRIAYATAGQGPPLVKAANWLNHLEYDWQSPVWRHLLHELPKDHLLIRYGERGNGLSDREVADISFDAFVRDLEIVVDAAGLDRFALLGISQGCAVSIAYAVRHPEPQQERSEDVDDKGADGEKAHERHVDPPRQLIPSKGTCSATDRYEDPHVGKKAVPFTFRPRTSTRLSHAQWEQKRIRQFLAGSDGRYWTRTSDPYDVNVVLYQLS